MACLAGSVMRFTVGIYPGHNGRWTHRPEHFDERTREKLDALDYLRRGEVRNAALFMNVTNEQFEAAKKLDREVVPYSCCPRDWWQSMEQLLADLKQAGL